MSSVRKLIEKSFEELGVVYDDAVLDKCADLCLEHDVDAEELVDSWMAFSVSHLHGGNPTAQHLARFEREIFGKKAKTSKTSRTFNDDLAELDYPDVKSVSFQTPQRMGRNRLAVSPRGGFSPASFSPIVGTPSSKYSSRNNAGTVVIDHEPVTVTNYFSGSVAIKKLSDLSETNNFMAYQLTDYAESTNLLMNRVLAEISKRFSLEEPVPIKTKHPVEILVAGRISCDADGKLNAESLLLEASPEAGGEIVGLDLSGLPEYSVFPGQFVAVQGLNVSGQKMIAKKLWCDGSLSDPPERPSLTGAIKIIAAAGPLTPTDSLTYQTLIDLLEVVVAEKPHLLILMGPLIDSQHPAVSSFLVAEKFQDMFDRLVDQIMEALKDVHTQVILVSSHRESHGPAVFPTFPVPTHSRSKFTILPDPSVISVEGIIIGLTSMDSLMHIGKEEVAFPPHSGDRLARLAGHILKQQSFYPLRPCAVGVPLDPRLERHLLLDVIPHILLLPSDLRCFIKEISGCTVVNPEHLAKGLVGGTYAKLIISTDGKIYGQVIRV